MTVINVEKGDITKSPSDAIVVNLFEGVASPEGGTGAIDKALGGAISELIKEKEITGKLGESTLIHTFGKIPAKRILIMGLGKREKFSTSVVRSISGHAARYLRQKGIKHAASITHGAGIGQLDISDSAQAIAEGVTLGLYEFKNYQSKKSESSSNGKSLESFTLIEQDEGRIGALKSGVVKGSIISASALLARNLVNEPANVVNPVKMAQVASAMAQEAGIPIEILGREDLMQNEMGAMLAVSAGSANEPQLIIMEYLGDPENPENNIALVGKGITFDSGGISIKPSASMWEMKGDMSGGASVIGAMKGISELKPKINVYGVVPAVENMPSGTAQRPGDIIRAMNGKTIEVDNTDAEGRLILADAISYIRQTKNVRKVVDIATLTGAIVIALGHVASGVMGTSQTLVDAVLSASKSTDEKMWQLPLFEEYKRQNHSDYADVKNTGGRPAGSITAALFIGEFTEGVEWAHLDIAGTFLSEKTTGHMIKGATGVPTRTLIKLVEDLAQTS
ncbi:MAG: leucyl aminopeptidase [Chloroflexi bacterium]|nr:leucyl aminopeptidase [Chloroflexota bacterium]|tara:strand:- start:2589 stop:4115 length:1527 start_codon:yes stop_codon:yes gene_type:complete